MEKELAGIMYSGQIISRQPFFGYQHWGILAEHEGEYYVLHNYPKRNIVADSIENFTKENQNLIFHNTPDIDNDLLWKRYEEAKDQKFSELSNNCEHFLEYMRGNTPHSQQVAAGAFLVALIYMI